MARDSMALHGRGRSEIGLCESQLTDEQLPKSHPVFSWKHKNSVR